MENKHHWNSIDTHPQGTVDRWTDNLVVVTNLGNVYALAFYVSDTREDSRFQRPGFLKKNERVEYWQYAPCAIPVSMTQ